MVKRTNRGSRVKARSSHKTTKALTGVKKTVYSNRAMSPSDIRQIKEHVVYLRSNYRYITDPKQKSEALREINKLKDVLREVSVY